MLITYLFRSGVLVAFLFFLALEGKGQVTFNNRIDIDGIKSSIITNVKATYSCYYAVGIFSDTLSKPRTNSFFAKFGLNGEILNFRPISRDSGSFEIWTPTLCFANSAIYALGYGSNSSGTSTFLVKLNEAGEILFLKWLVNPLFPDDIFTRPRYMIITDTCLISVEEFYQPDRGKREARILKFNLGGEIIWEKYYKDQNLSFIPRSLGNYNNGFILGGTITNVDYAWTNLKANSLLLNYDSNGTIKWKFQSQIQSMPVESIVEDENENLIIGANRGHNREINGSVDRMVNEFLIFKIDHNQVQKWDRSIRDSIIHPLNNLEKILKVEDGIIYAGHLLNRDGYLMGSIGKLTDDGDSLWLRQFSFEQDTTDWVHNYVYDMVDAHDGGYLLVGETIDNTSPINQYGWMLKVDEFGCLIPGCQLSNTKNISGETELDLSIFPNPTSEYLNFLVKDSNLVQLSYRIITTEGKVVSTNETIKPNVT